MVVGNAVADINGGNIEEGNQVVPEQVRIMIFT